MEEEEGELSWPGGGRVSVRTTEGSVLTSLFVSLSLTTSVDVSVKNWLSKSVHIHNSKAFMMEMTMILHSC